MITFTLVARIVDGLPLAASVDDNSQTGTGDGTDSGGSDNVKVSRYLSRKFTPLTSPTLPTAASFSYMTSAAIHYIIENGVVFITISDRSFARLLAFAYLTELKTQFMKSYSQEDIQTQKRPYSFIRFESEINKIMKRYMNTRSLRTQNIDLGSLAALIQNYPTFSFQELFPDYVPELASAANGRRKSQNRSIANVSSSESLWLYLKMIWHHHKLFLVYMLSLLYIAYWSITFDLWFGLGYHPAVSRDDGYDAGGVDADQEHLIETEHVPYYFYYSILATSLCSIVICSLLLRQILRKLDYDSLLLPFYIQTISNILFLSQCLSVEAGYGFSYSKFRNNDYFLVDRKEVTILGGLFRFGMMFYTINVISLFAWAYFKAKGEQAKLAKYED
jgi:hypothetical protein